MNTIWTEQGITKLRELIGSGKELNITEFLLSGSETESGLTVFEGNSSTEYENFPSTIYKGLVEKSYISDDGFLTLCCSVSGDTEADFYFNGIGIILKTDSDSEILLGVSKLNQEKITKDDNKKIWLKFPMVIDHEKSVFDLLSDNNEISEHNLHREIGKHNKDIASHPYLKSKVNSVAEVSRLELSHKLINAEFELFTPEWTLIKEGRYKVEAVDINGLVISLDSTADLEPGNYVIYEDDKIEEIEIKEIIDSTKVKIKQLPANSFSDSAFISKTSIKDCFKGEVSLKPNDIYISKKINLGKCENNHRIIVRKTTLGGGIDFYVKESDKDSYSKIVHKWTRKIDDTYSDYEYEIDIDNEFYFKIKAKNDNLRIVHIVCAGEQNTKVEGVHTPPEKPVNKFPLNEAVDITETPTLEIEKYSHPLGTPQKSIEFQISSKPDFSIIVHDSGKQLPGTTYSVPDNILLGSTKYYWRARVDDIEGGVSFFSDGCSFTTAFGNKFIETPKNRYPVYGQTNVSDSPTLFASEFTVKGGSDKHIKSQWRIRKAADDWSKPVLDTGECEFLESYDVLFGNLELGENKYYFQVRYKGESLGWSQWSQETSFETDIFNANAIGVVLEKEGGMGGKWENIDGRGNKVNPNKSFWDTHSIYSKIEDVSIDGQAMVRIPKFYYKVCKLESGNFKGKKAWFVSDKKAPGYEIHPAFLNGNKEVDHFYVGKYETVNDLKAFNHKAGSVKYQKPLVYLNINDMKKRCEARNVDGIDGFHLWTMHELGAIQFLCLIEAGQGDVQSVFGEGNISSPKACLTGQSSAYWRGVYELWGNYLTIVSGIRLDNNNQIMLEDSFGKLNGTGQKAPVSGWIMSMNDSLPSIFYPEFFGYNSENTSFGDSYIGGDVGSGVRIILHGGLFTQKKCYTGIFSMETSLEQFKNDCWSGRLAKK